MNSIDDRARVNHELRKLGFGGLDDPNLITSIAFVIRDHAHFRNQLFSVEPLKRRLAYETLRPHLRFVAKPLAVYEAEMKEFAEKNQLPRYNSETGELIPFKSGSVDLDQLASEAIAQNYHEKNGGLILVCAACTVQDVFRAKIRKDAEKESHAAGWRSDGRKNWCVQHVPERVTMSVECASCPITARIRAWDPQDGYAKARLRGWIIGDDAKCPKCSMKRITLQ